MGASERLPLEFVAVELLVEGLDQVIDFSLVVEAPLDLDLLDDLLVHVVDLREGAGEVEDIEVNDSLHVDLLEDAHRRRKEAVYQINPPRCATLLLKLAGGGGAILAARPSEALELVLKLKYLLDFVEEEDDADGPGKAQTFTLIVNAESSRENGEG
eukprot:CAMPEP_0168616282 /NCGR_PEP_ID=MMETSP0449_2-20121227/4948_1 /TAXON_ID=1082188 /ORGANISM="Strombidium rassoulzadegani, Strain ras09" /LENGTH=156 /DNA_ID=CAMNT_0008657065 /DNA_START=302 /DNA_END=772 /DNA_ORIENTATION=+